MSVNMLCSRGGWEQSSGDSWKVIPPGGKTLCVDS